MTSDATQTEQVTHETENDQKDLNDPDGLKELISGARVVLWDFDGPICRLFAGHSAERVATDLVEWLEGRGLHGLLTESERESLDPHAVLRAVDRRHPGSDLVAKLSAAHPGGNAGRLLGPAHPLRRPADPHLDRGGPPAGHRDEQLPRVVRKYLTDRGLLGCFAPTSTAAPSSSAGSSRTPTASTAP